MSQDWISVGELGDAFAPNNNCLPPVPDLAGRQVVLNFENGWSIQHSFDANGALTWEILEGEDKGASGTESYVATRPRAGIYFVDFVKSQSPAETVSLVLNFEDQVFLAVLGNLPSADESAVPPLRRIEQKLELTSVRATFLRGTIAVPYSSGAAFPTVTDELIGKRIAYRYSAAELYEHIYLNPSYYSWHCLEGSEKGLCDTDRCHYYKIKNDLYLFVWREKIIPTLGVICIDLQAMKTTGKIFGYETDASGKTRNFGVGAFAQILGVVARPD